MGFEATTMRAPAKINWMLRVLGRRDDGYHEIETIFQTIALFDSLTFTRADRVTLTCDDPSIPLDESNLVWRAAHLMMSRFGSPPVLIELRKSIPTGGGLGGGSSDAATTLVFLARHAKVPPSTRELREAALDVGSDVPFFLTGGTCYATGRGEKIVELAEQNVTPLIIVLPVDKVLTAEAYSMLADARGRGAIPSGMAAGFEQCHEMAVRGLLGDTTSLTNDFEQVIFEAYPAIAEAFERVRRSGALWARMSGSGSTIVGAYDSRAKRNRALERLSDSLTVLTSETC